MALPLAAIFTGGFFAKVMAFVIASAAVRIFAAIGLTVVTYTGIDLVFTQVQTEFNTLYSGIPADLFAMLQLWGFDFFFQSVFSAITAIVAIRGLASIKKAVIK